jgi:hypothetical protein
MYWLIIRYVAVLAFGVLMGWVVNGYRLNSTISSLKASQAEEVARYYQAARTAEKALITATEGIRRQKDAEIKVINNKLQSALSELRQRQERPSSADTARDCKGATGAELSRQDAEFLIREAARADQLRSALELCYRQYDTVRESLLRAN